MFVEAGPSIGNTGINFAQGPEQAIAPLPIVENPLQKDISRETATGVILTGVGVAFVLYGSNEIINGFNNRSFTKVVFGGLLLVGGVTCIRNGLKHFKHKESLPK